MAAPADPILRNALRYTLSPREYATLHKYVLSRSRLLHRAAPAVEPLATNNTPDNPPPTDDFNARAVRHALRLFAAGVLGMKAWDLALSRLTGRPRTRPAPPFHRSATLRLPLSLAAILLLYRLLFRFLARLRAHLLDRAALPFCRRNPRTAALLTSRFAPSAGAALAGLLLGICPASRLRAAAALWALGRALEWTWDLAETQGRVWGVRAVATAAERGRRAHLAAATTLSARELAGQGGRVVTVKNARPWWFGSWLLQPVVLGQLLHALVFDRDCVPRGVAEFMLGKSAAYLQPRPEGYPAHLAWPSPEQIVDDVAEMARLKWPVYISPTLFPTKPALPPTITHVAPLTASAHPLLAALSCAALHPTDPSCLRTYLTCWLRAFPPLMRVFLVLYAATSFLPNLARRLHDAPYSTLRTLVARPLRSAVFATGALSSAWGMLCLSQRAPGRALAGRRVFAAGFVAGLWAWVERRRGRALFLASARASVQSVWAVGVKRRWWRGVRGGDVGLFVLALALGGVVYDVDARAAVHEPAWRKGVSWVRGQGWRDWCELAEEEAEEISAGYEER